MKAFYAVVAVGLMSIAISLVTSPDLTAQDLTAKVQIAHNAADPTAVKLDVYLNGELYLDDFEFRTSTEFRDFVAGTETHIGLAPNTSTSVADTIINIAYTLVPNSRNVLVIEGVLTPASFKANSDPSARPIGITVMRITDVRETGINPAQVDALFWHGATDVGALDLYAGPSTELASNISYGSVSPYFNVLVGSVPFGVHNAGGALIETYRGNFGYRAGQAVILLTSGFLTPAENQNGPRFGLYLIDNEGGPFERLEPQSTTPRAFVQFVNNSADVDNPVVDIWVDNVLVADNLEFRKATPYLQLNSNTQVIVVVAPPTSTTPADKFAGAPSVFSTSFTFTPKQHMLVVNGLVSTSGYDVNPDPLADPLGIAVHRIEDIKAGTTPDNAELFIMNGSTNAPALDLHARSTTDSIFITNGLSYGKTSQNVVIPLGALSIVANRPLGPSNAAVWQYDFSPFAGKIIAGITSGFIYPQQKVGGAPFALLLVFDDGSTAVINQNTLDVIDDMTSSSNGRVFPNPASTDVTLSFENTTDAITSISIFNLLGARVSQEYVGLQPAGLVRAQLECSMLATGMYNVLVEAGATRTMIPLWIVR
ncbi:MAG: T9SS type A sorting domain-containing protein [bacterium]|nr:T9SS type A sorting domain-containing protein [bacterium]